MTTGLAAALVALAALYSLYRWCYLPWRCNAFERTAERTLLLTENAEGPVRRATIARENLERTLQSIAHCPHDLDLYMIAGASFRQLERSSEAIPMYEAALTLDRRPEIYLNLGQAEAEANRISDAVRHLATAVIFDPSLISEVPGQLQPSVRAFVQARSSSRSSR